MRHRQLEPTAGAVLHKNSKTFKFYAKDSENLFDQQNVTINHDKRERLEEMNN